MSDQSQMSKKLGGAFVLGASGEVGREVLKELVAKDIFSKVVVITRRKLTDIVPDSVEEKIVDFDKIEEHSDAFEGLEVGFCCLGTTRAASGAAGFYKVDHDYVVNCAKVALGKGCKHFSVVSSTGANINSYFLYPQTKGQMEEDLKGLGFSRLSIYRPALLIRKNSRLIESVSRVALTPLHWLFPTKFLMNVSTMAKVMVYQAQLVKEGNQKVDLFLNPDILQIAKEQKIE